MQTFESTGIRQQVLDSIARCAWEHGVRKVILFGSRARGDHGSRSDIDLASLGGDFPSFALDVEEYAPTLLEFDFVDLGTPLQESLRRSIEDEGVVLYAQAG